MATEAADAFYQDQLLWCRRPVTFVLDTLRDMQEARFVAGITWIAPMLSSVVVCNDRAVREAVSVLYDKHVNPFIERCAR